jgi:hypothetical protein
MLIMDPAILPSLPHTMFLLEDNIYYEARRSGRDMKR